MDKRGRSEPLSLMQNTLRLEGLSHGYTMLKDVHCPDDFIVYEISYVNQIVGGDLTIETCDGRRIDVPAGSGIILPGGGPLRFTNHKPGKAFSAWHGVQYSIMDTIDPLTLLDKPYVLDKRYGSRIGAINRELSELSSLRDKNALEHVVKCHTLGMQLLEIVLTVSVLKQDAGERVLRTDPIQPVLRYIKKNLGGKIRTEDLSSVMNLSIPRFFELFREAAGMAPGRYIQQQRMKKAQELLMNTDLRIHEVGESVGYEDPFHFSRLFKKNFKVSPELFRRQWR